MIVVGRASATKAIQAALRRAPAATVRAKTDDAACLQRVLLSLGAAAEAARRRGREGLVFVPRQGRAGGFRPFEAVVVRVPAEEALARGA